MKHHIAWMAAALLLCACQPNDTKVKSVKEQLDDGDVVQMKGDRYKGCSKGPDWDDLRLSADTERARIVLGKQQSIVNPGIFNCYRIGSRIVINVGREAKPENGVVQIRRISWARLDKLNKYALQGKFFASSEDFNQYLAAVKPRMKPDHMGYVSIIDFVYVSGSAADEASIREEDIKNANGDGYEETTKDGDSLSRCNKDWTDIAVLDAEFQAAILEKKLASWFQLGQRNCFKQGAEALVKGAFDPASPVLGRVKIKKIKKFRSAFLDEKRFSLSGFDYAKLRDLIKQLNSTKNEEFMTVIDFEVLP